MSNDTSGDGRNGADGQKQSPEEAALSARLERLDHRLAEKRHDRADQIDRQGENGDGAAGGNAAMALRLSSELIAGVVVGAVIGWGFDKLLSTSPFGFIVFFLLGFVAGVVNLMRAAGAVPSAYDRLKEPDQKN